MKFYQKIQDKLTPILWTISGVLLIALIVARAIFPEMMWLTWLVAGLFVATLAWLITENHRALRTRGAAYSLNSLITVLLVIAIVGVCNFVVSKHPLKADLTKDKLHTLSDQTEKVVKGIQKPVKAVLYGRAASKDKYRPLFDNYKELNSKFEVSYVDIDREPSRAKEAGIRKYDTLKLVIEKRDQQLEEPNEEKLTNALIKLLKEKSPTLCAITGHGEKNFSGTDAEGYEAMKKALNNQSDEVKEHNLALEPKIPETCDGIAIIGPTKPFLPAEVDAIKNYLDNGGHALLALDMNFRGPEYTPELLTLIESWNVKAVPAVIVDPVSKMLGVDASVSIVANYQKDHAITKDFQANSLLPFSRPLEVIPNAPAGVTVQWLGQTTPKSFAISDMKMFASGQIQFAEDQAKMGPYNVAVAVDGKKADSKATRNTRIAVFGSSFFASNNYARLGGNMDLFLNSASWVLEDESMISIRAKEEGAGKIELSEKMGRTIFLLTVVLNPLLIATGGIANWVRRKKL